MQSVCEKQIKLDLYRTLPSNTHFQRDGSGVSDCIYNACIWCDYSTAGCQTRECVISLQSAQQECWLLSSKQLINYSTTLL